MPSEQTGAERPHAWRISRTGRSLQARSRVFRISNTLRTQAMPHTKADLIAAIAFNRKLSIGRADAIVNQIFTAIAETLVRGDGIEIRGFGSFTVRHYGAYEGRNPRTGAPSYVKAKRLPFFKVGKELRERIEAGRLTERAMHRGKLPPSTL